MEKIVEFTPAYDKRHVNPSKNYGIHGVELRMVLKGEKGAVQFVLFTHWMLPHNTRELKAKFLSNPTNESVETYAMLSEPSPCDLGYHSFVPMYDGQETITDSCPYLDGKPRAIMMDQD